MEESPRNQLITIFFISNSLESLQLELFQKDDTFIERIDITNYISKTIVIEKRLETFYCTVSNSIFHLEHHFECNFIDIEPESGKTSIKKQFPLFQIIFSLEFVKQNRTSNDENISSKDQQINYSLAVSALRKIQKKVIKKIQFQSSSRHQKTSYQRTNSSLKSKSNNSFLRTTQNNILHPFSKDIYSHFFQPRQQYTKQLLCSSKIQSEENNQKGIKQKKIDEKLRQLSSKEVMKEIQNCFSIKKNHLSAHNNKLKRKNQLKLSQNYQEMSKNKSNCQTPWRLSHKQFSSLLQENTQKLIKIQSGILSLIGRSTPLSKSHLQSLRNYNEILKPSKNDKLANITKISPFGVIVSKSFRKNKKN